MKPSTAVLGALKMGPRVDQTLLAQFARKKSLRSVQSLQVPFCIGKITLGGLLNIQLTALR